MLILTKFDAVLQDTKSVVSFATNMSNRVDVSKKFVKLNKETGQYVFSKTVDQALPIKLGEYYVVEINNRITLEPNVRMMQDIISVTQINNWLTLLVDMTKAAMELW